MRKTKDKGHRAHGQKEIMDAYGLTSTPIVQGLVEDINGMYAYGRNSEPIVQTRQGWTINRQVFKTAR